MRQVEQVAPGVHRYADGLVNWYLLEEAGELTLVDTGWPRSWPRIEQAVQAIGRQLSDLHSVLLTHGHADHMGAAERARRAGVPVRVRAAESDRVRGRARGSSPFTLVPGLLPHLRRPTALRFVLHATRHGFMTPTWVTSVEPFDDGAQLDVPGRPRAVATPGHTEGHTSYHLAGAGVLLSGDALATRNVLTGERGPRLLPDALNTDTARARESLAALEALDADLLLPGHGEPWRGSAAEAVRQARAAG
jgi:glyoxylase-like metal-dependent hydrolase (beta-lactamase superfamily II)